MAESSSMFLRDCLFYALNHLQNDITHTHPHPNVWYTLWLCSK